MRPQPAPVGGRSRSADLGTTPPEGLSFLYRSDLPAFQSMSDPVSSSLGDASFDLLLAEFTARWERGDAPRAEDDFGRLSADRPGQRVELIYREFCLAGQAGRAPTPEEYLARFPAEAEALRRLFGVHDLLGST